MLAGHAIILTNISEHISDFNNPVSGKEWLARDYWVVEQYPKLWISFEKEVMTLFTATQCPF